MDDAAAGAEHLTDWLVPARCRAASFTSVPAPRMPDDMVSAMAYIVMAYIVMASTTNARRHGICYGLYSYGLYSYGLCSYGPY